MIYITNMQMIVTQMDKAQGTENNPVELTYLHEFHCKILLQTTLSPAYVKTIAT